MAINVGSTRSPKRKKRTVQLGTHHLERLCAVESDDGPCIKRSPGRHLRPPKPLEDEENSAGSDE